MSLPSQTMGLFEAKTHLSELVARAEQGEETVITRHNKPVAKIVPMRADAPFDVERRMKAVAAMREIGREIARTYGPITREDIAQWIRDGREEREQHAEQTWPGATGKE